MITTRCSCCLPIRLFEESDRSEKWFDRKEISYGNMMKILELRDEIILDLIKLGFDPFQNDHAKLCLPASMDDKSCSLDVFYTKIKALKASIYEGYKINTLTYDESGYFHNGLELKLWSSLISNKIGDVNPRYVITNKIGLRIDRNKKISLYQLSATYISIMDGYVDV
jgi:hypothetical protein